MCRQDKNNRKESECNMNSETNVVLSDLVRIKDGNYYGTDLQDAACKFVLYQLSGDTHPRYLARLSVYDEYDEAYRDEHLYPLGVTRVEAARDALSKFDKLHKELRV